MDLTYASYLKLDQLLDLQQPRSQPAEHDEMLFIVAHQTYELWFKLVLHELDQVCVELSQGRLYEALATFKRVRTILKILVEQVDILETLTPMSFNSFRARLEHASGFQSSQFREIEFALGYKRPDMLRYQTSGTPAYERLLARLRAPSVWDALIDFLRVQGANLPPSFDPGRPERTTEPDPAVEKVLLEFYHTRPDLVLLFELMTDFDEGFQEWRYRHIKLVERTIGSKHGTGGSLGVAFLQKSLFHPVFPDLWVIRHRL
jgi:tryptophan 2,3-dioxygenase